MLEEKIRLLAEKYINDNPPAPLKYRAFYSGGVVRGSDYRYDADFNRIYPNAAYGDKAELICKYDAPRDTALGMRITLYGRMKLELNDETVFTTSVFKERESGRDEFISVKLKKGENLFKFTFTKTSLGFGAKFGTNIAKWDYIFTRPDIPDTEGAIYRLNGGEWEPRLKEAEIELNEGEYALFYAKDHNGRGVFIRGDKFPSEEGYQNAFGIEGFGAFVGLWPLSGDYKPDFLNPINNTFWRFKYENVWLRPYYGEGNFGKWSYPLGVTMCGLLRAGETLDDDSVTDYAKSHMDSAIDAYPYAVWDRKTHGGAASLHNLLCSLDSLDDCGSFAAAIEDAHLACGYERGSDILDFVYNYIEHSQPRTETGAFCRKNQLHSFHNDTMWLDDMYMSVPFLAKRYAITGETSAIYDAAEQFLLYEKTHKMENGLLSHVYDMRRSMRTGVAWGRGNGWFLFSMTELFKYLPQNYEKNSELERLFKSLCERLAIFQSKDGRWRQVIDDEDAYLETSVSAMIASSYIRGFRAGLLDESFLRRALFAINSIAENCVDDVGNLYGVCRGSEFSFSGEYYKEELLPKTNDTHGIGIVLTAFSEVENFLHNQGGRYGA